MLTEDLTVFFDDFGQDVTFDPEIGSNFTVKAIFDNAFYNAQIGDIDINGTLPVLTCVSSDISTIKSKDKVLVGSVNYTVKEIQPDGTGLSKVILARFANA